MTWKKYKGKSVQDFETWIGEMNHTPYIYDPVLQSIDWVKELIEAIKKVESVIGTGDEEGIAIQYLYWEKLSSWQFILSCFSIARAFGGITITDKNLEWKSIFDQFRYWVDSTLNHTDTRELYLSGASFFYDMHLFFNDNRKLSDPKKLAKEVLAYKKC